MLVLSVTAGRVELVGVAERGALLLVVEDARPQGATCARSLPAGEYGRRPRSAARRSRGGAPA